MEGEIIVGVTGCIVAGIVVAVALMFVISVSFSPVVVDVQLLIASRIAITIPVVYLIVLESIFHTFVCDFQFFREHACLS